jgi:DNA-directed RNA polymerase subunit K/omega
MLNPKIEKFLEENNFTYLFLLLANLEAERLSNLPYSVKKNFKDKITNLALEHIASNNIPDYIVEELNLMNDEIE